MRHLCHIFDIVLDTIDFVNYMVEILFEVLPVFGSKTKSLFDVLDILILNQTLNLVTNTFDFLITVMLNSGDDVLSEIMVQVYLSVLVDFDCMLFGFFVL